MEIDKKPTILIADDDKQALNVLYQILVGQGYNVVTAGDGYIAREKVFIDKPDLVILDNHMPGIYGNEICREIKAHPDTRLIPVVMLTGYTDSPEKIDSIEAGADDFINKPFKTIELTSRIRSLLKVKFLNDKADSAEGVIFALARAIEAKDVYTQGHTERVSRFALAVGYHLGLSVEEQDALFKGGILHDIGKIAIPDAILNKPGRLTEEERKIIETHADRGEKICQPLNSIKPALQIIRHHHEKLDGSGYPDHLTGTRIPMVARIMAIVDVYDALTTNRAYRTAFPQDKAFEVLEREGEMGWWDKKILKEFKTILKTM